MRARRRRPRGARPAGREGQAAGSEVIVFGPHGDDGTAGVSWPEDVAELPSPSPGHVWTNRVMATASLPHAQP